MKLESETFRTNLEAIGLLEYWAKKGVIPLYSGIIDNLRKDAYKSQGEFLEELKWKK